MSTSITAQTVSIGAQSTTISAAPAETVSTSAPIVMRTVVKAQDAFAPTAPFVRKDGDGRKRIVLDYGKLFAAYRSDPEKIRRTTIPAVPSPEGNNRVELREIHSVAGHRNHQKHVVLLGDSNGLRKTYADTKSILHEVPTLRTSWVASLLADVGDVLSISVSDRGEITSLFYRIVSFCSWPSDAGVSSIRGDIGVNIELIAIRTVNIMTRDVSVWQDESDLGGQLYAGVEDMFVLVQELFQKNPEDTQCYLEYFGARYEDDAKSDLFVVPEGGSVSYTTVDKPDEFLLEVRDVLVDFRKDINGEVDDQESEKTYDYPLRGTFRYDFSGDTTTLTLTVPNPRKNHSVPAVELTTTLTDDTLPTWLVNETILSLGEVTVRGIKQAAAGADLEEGDDQTPDVQGYTIEFMTRM